MEMLLYNNQRRYKGLAPRRKKGSGKRYKTRCEAWESICAFLDYCNGLEIEEHKKGYGNYLR